MMVDFDRWYRADASLKDDPDDELVNLLKVENIGKSLDLGCGRGRNTLYLASLGYEVVAVDISKIAILQLIEHGKVLGLNIECETCSLLDFEFGEQFDLIVFSYVLHFILKRPEQINFLYKIMDYTKNNGIVFIKAPLTEMSFESLCLKKGFLNRLFTHSNYNWEIIEDYVKLTGDKKDFEVNVFIARKVG
jgi:SAM-dependent methyltransferase